MKKYLLIISLLFSIHCSGTKKQKIKEFEVVKIEGITKSLYDIWGLKEIKGKPIDLTKGIILEINTLKMTFQGNAACNTIAGEIESSSKSNIHFTNVISTRMTCQAIEDEQLYLNLLSTIHSFQLKSMHLLFFDKTGELIFDFIKID